LGHLLAEVRKRSPAVPTLATSVSGQQHTDKQLMKESNEMIEVLADKVRRLGTASKG
jgi:hypothetical protein